jgi:hypothetical protein
VAWLAALAALAGCDCQGSTAAADGDAVVDTPWDRGADAADADGDGRDAPGADGDADADVADDAAVDPCLGHCGNGVQDCGETGVDCGAECVACCGGSYCPCEDGRSCVVGQDCLSRSCQGGTCQPPSCTDGIKNAQECGVDCGGSCPTPCATERIILDVFDGASICASGCSRDVQGGLLETGSWTPLDGISRLVYDFGRPVDCGRLMVEVDNFDPWNQFQPRDLTDPYTEFISLFDGREDNPSDRFNHYSDYSQIDVVYPPACFDAGDPACTPNYSRIKPNAGLLTACDWDSGRYCADCLQLGTTHYVFELRWTLQGLSLYIDDVEQTYYPYPVYPNPSCTFTCSPKTPELRYLYIGRPMMDWQGYLVGPRYRRVELEATVE